MIEFKLSRILAVLIFLNIGSVGITQNSDSISFHNSLKILDHWITGTYKIIPHDPFGRFPNEQILKEESKNRDTISLNPQDIVNSLDDIEVITGIRSRLNLKFIFVDQNIDDSTSHSKNCKRSDHPEKLDSTSMFMATSQSSFGVFCCIEWASLIVLTNDTLSRNELEILDLENTLSQNYLIYLGKKWSVKDPLCSNKYIYWQDRKKWIQRFKITVANNR
jgi:hypothetical protein